MIRQQMPPDPALVLGAPPPPPAFNRVVYDDVPIVSEAPDIFTEVPASTVVETEGELWTEPWPEFTYLAGAAGSGKTFAMRAYSETADGIVLCATTGIAAINLGGETINSILGYFDTASLQESYINGFLAAKIGKLWRAGVRRLVLDEVSMLAADQLGFLVHAIEAVNNREYVLDTKDDDDGVNPSMGLTLVGDFLQLPPVKAEFAFKAPEWDRFAKHVRTLTTIRRQADPGFITMLRDARAGRGERVADYFQSRNLLQQETDDAYPGPTILAKNDSVDRYNALRLQRLPGAPLTFQSARWGKQRSEWGNPQKPPSTWGIPETLTLKEGALVMILANRRLTIDPDDPTTKRLVYVNGDLGELMGADMETAYFLPGGIPVHQRVAYVRLQRTGEVVSVFPVERQVKVPCDSARRKELREQGHEDRVDGKWEIAGAITYMPLRVAYATTVHKSQGLSLDAVQVNVRDAFFKTPGMLYVALSRARTLEGLRLVGSRAAVIERATSDPQLKEWA